MAWRPAADPAKLAAIGGRVRAADGSLELLTVYAFERGAEGRLQSRWVANVRGWLRRVTARDLFGCDARSEPELAVRRAEERLAAFAEQSVARESAVGDIADSTSESRLARGDDERHDRYAGRRSRPTMDRGHLAAIVVAVLAVTSPMVPALLFVACVNSTSGQALDMRKRHVDRSCHRCDIARVLGQHVPALEGAYQSGRELVYRCFGRKRAGVLKPAQHVCQESLPFDEELREGLTGDIVVVGDLGGQRAERTAVGAMP